MCVWERCSVCESVCVRVWERERECVLQRQSGCEREIVRAFSPMHQTAGKQVAEEMLLCFSEGQYLCKWFIGLVFHNTQTANIDLTYDIQSFSDAGQLVLFCFFTWNLSLSLVRCA